IDLALGLEISAQSALVLGTQFALEKTLLQSGGELLFIAPDFRGKELRGVRMRTVQRHSSRRLAVSVVQRIFSEDKESREIVAVHQTVGRDPTNSAIPAFH